jgi:queuine tRNA-ribosyltransferase
MSEGGGWSWQGSPTTRARRGRLLVGPHVIETPQFMPVATRGAVRGLRTQDLEDAGASMLLANTWHLLEQPGLATLDAVGGLAALMGWRGAVLTDSGGFQAFSLGDAAAVDDEGMTLTDPKSGRRTRLTPETVWQVQRSIRSDVAMVLDHCVPHTASHDEASAAAARTHRWLDRALAARLPGDPRLYGIVQGGVHLDLREESAAFLASRPVDGFGIGGLAVGESAAVREAQLDAVVPLLPPDRPRYLMGLGSPRDLLEAIHRGVDLFDCIWPNAVARHGLAVTSAGRVDLRRGVYARCDLPLDAACACSVCTRHSRAFLHHLLRAEEPLAWTLIATHNVHFILALMNDARGALDDGTFPSFYRERRDVLDAPDAAFPPKAPARARVRRPTTRGAWTLVEQPGWQGAPPFRAVRHDPSGEVMHGVLPADVEVDALYVGPMGVVDAAARDGAPWVVWDVGMGAASTAVAIVRAWEAVPSSRRLILVSFERDLDPLRLALDHHDHFPRLRHAGPRALLQHGAFETDRVRWTLALGDARDHLATAPSPDAIAWDPFSSEVDAPMWTTDTLRLALARCAGRQTSLHTYARATPVRTALLAAGWFVGPGPGTGPKEETTRAWSQRPDAPLLDGAFLRKWASSSAQWPPGTATTERPAVVEALRAHPQFLGLDARAREPLERA